jgi:hypothetical protein
VTTHYSIRLTVMYWSLIVPYLLTYTIFTGLQCYTLTLYYIMIKQLSTSYVVLPYTDVCEEAKGNGRERCSVGCTILNNTCSLLGAGFASGSTVAGMSNIRPGTYGNQPNICWTSNILYLLLAVFRMLFLGASSGLLVQILFKVDCYVVKIPL